MLALSWCGHGLCCVEKNIGLLPERDGLCACEREPEGNKHSSTTAHNKQPLVLCTSIYNRCFLPLFVFLCRVHTPHPTSRGTLGMYFSSQFCRQGATASKEGGGPSHRNTESDASSGGFAGGPESALSINLAAVCLIRSF